MGKRVPVRTKAKLRDAANEHMAMLKKSPERAMSFFQAPRSNMPPVETSWGRSNSHVDCASSFKAQVAKAFYQGAHSGLATHKGEG
jgi:hypothetical protein